MPRRSQAKAHNLKTKCRTMKSKYAKQPTSMEIENLIYEVSLNRALILLMLEELEKTNPSFTEKIQELLNEQPQRVYGLVSQFVEEPSPYYAPLLEMRKTNDDADKAAEVLKNLLNEPPIKEPKGKKKN